MDLETRRNNRREKLVTNMARKLAVGNGVQKIAAEKRKKKLQRLTYIAAVVMAFLISGLIIYFHLPKQYKYDPEQFRISQAQRNPVNRLSADYQEKKISADEYALYLKDILIRYDSLPDAYRIDIPFIKATDVYDSLIAVWPFVNLRIRKTLQDQLPKLEHQLKENQFKTKD